jgi:hypothetical protein
VGLLGAGRFQDAQGAGGVGLVAADRVVDAAWDAGHGREVDHRLGAVDGLGQAVGLEDRAFDETRLKAGEIAGVAGGEVVDDGDVVARIQQAADEIGADESGSSIDEDSYGGSVAERNAGNASAYDGDLLHEGNRGVRTCRGTGRCSPPYTSRSASQQVTTAFRRALASTSGSVRSRHTGPSPPFRSATAAPPPCCQVIEARAMSRARR